MNDMTSPFAALLTMTTAGASADDQSDAPGVGDNSGPTISQLDKLMAKLGAESVNIARPKLGIALVRAAADGIIDEDDVEARYDAYLAGRTKVQSKQLLAAGVEDGNGKKANVSKCRQLVRMSMLPGVDGPALLDRTVTLRGNMIGGDDKLEAPFDAFVKVARAQIARPEADLSDDEIAEQIRKATPAEKDTIAKLVAAYRSTYKLHEEVKLPGTEAALQGIADALVECGGEIPAMTKEEKAQAAFMAKAAKMGFTVTH